MAEDEILDLVDENDDVIGTVNRRDYPQFLEQKLGYIRAAELFIVNDKGQIWIPVRTAHKKIAPNGYDYSAAGHVETGESYEATIIREAEEEINIQINPRDLEFVAKMKTEYARYFRGIFVLRSNETPDFNRHDFVSAEWLTPTQVVKNIQDGHPAKESLVETIEVLEDYLTKRGK